MLVCTKWWTLSSNFFSLKSCEPPTRTVSIFIFIGDHYGFTTLSCRKMAAFFGQVSNCHGHAFSQSIHKKMLFFWDTTSLSGGLALTSTIKVEAQSGGGQSSCDILGKLRLPRTMHCLRSGLWELQFGLGWLGHPSGLPTQGFWRKKSKWHINVKGLEAAIHIVKSLAKQNQTVHLCVENSVVFSYLRRGECFIIHFNALVRHLWAWCMEGSIVCNLSW